MCIAMCMAQQMPRRVCVIACVSYPDHSHSVTIEILGKEDKMKALTDLLEPYGVLRVLFAFSSSVPTQSIRHPCAWHQARVQRHRMLS